MALADVNNEDVHGCTPLILATSSPKLFLVDLVSRRDRHKRESIRRAAFHQQQRMEMSQKGDPLSTQRISDLVNRGKPSKENVNFKGMDPFTVWTFHPNRIELIVMEKLLAKKKIKVDASDKKRRTPLIYAARYGRKYASSRLMHAKANLRIMDADGKTALHHAACNEHVETATLLLAANSNV